MEQESPARQKHGGEQDAQQRIQCVLVAHSKEISVGGDKFERSLVQDVGESGASAPLRTVWPQVNGEAFLRYGGEFPVARQGVLLEFFLADVKGEGNMADGNVDRTAAPQVIPLPCQVA